MQKPQAQTVMTKSADLPVKIRIQNLSKVFETRRGQFVALDNVCIDIPDGCFYMIVGPSGCGKTTLLEIMGGLEMPSSGSVAIAQAFANDPDILLMDEPFSALDEQNKLLLQ